MQSLSLLHLPEFYADKKWADKELISNYSSYPF